jgi:hypothetical protein
MKNMEVARSATLAPGAKALQQVRLGARAERRAMQIAANAEVRRRWIDADVTPNEITLADRIGATTEHACRETTAARVKKDDEYDSRDAPGRLIQTATTGVAASRNPQFARRHD